MIIDSVNQKKDYFLNRENEVENFKRILKYKLDNEINDIFVVYGYRFIGKSAYVSKVFEQLDTVIKNNDYRIISIEELSYYDEHLEDGVYLNSIYEKINLLHNKKKIIHSIFAYSIKILSHIINFIIKIDFSNLLSIPKVFLPKNEREKVVKTINDFFRKNKVILFIKDARKIDYYSLNIICNLIIKYKLNIVFEYYLRDDSSLYNYEDFTCFINKKASVSPEEINLPPLSFDNYIKLFKHKNCISEDMELPYYILDKLKQSYRINNGDLFSLRKLTINSLNKNIEVSEKNNLYSFEKLTSDQKFIIFIVYLHFKEIEIRALKEIISTDRLHLQHIDNLYIDETIKTLNENKFLVQSAKIIKLDVTSTYYIQNNLPSIKSELIFKLAHNFIINYYILDLGIANKSCIGEPINNFKITIKNMLLLDPALLSNNFHKIVSEYDILLDPNQKYSFITWLTYSIQKINKLSDSVVDFLIEENFNCGLYQDVITILSQYYNENKFDHVVFMLISNIVIENYKYYDNNFEYFLIKYKNEPTKTYILNAIRCLYLIETNSDEFKRTSDAFLKDRVENETFYYYVLRMTSTVGANDEDIKKLQKCLDYFKKTGRRIDVGSTYITLFSQYFLKGNYSKAKLFLNRAEKNLDNTVYNRVNILNNKAILEMIQTQTNRNTLSKLNIAIDMVQEPYTKLLIINNILAYFLIIKDIEKINEYSSQIEKNILELENYNYLKTCMYYNLIQCSKVTGNRLEYYKTKIRKIYHQEKNDFETNEAIELCELILYNKNLSFTHQDYHLIIKNYIYMDLADWSFLVKKQDIL